MADEDERSLVDEPSSDPDTLLLRDDSSLPDDFLDDEPEDDDVEEKTEGDFVDEKPEGDVVDEKPVESEDVPDRQQGDDIPWERHWSRERSEDSTRERSVDSRDSATRERDLRYAEARKLDRERGRREPVFLYRNSDTESVHRNSESEHSDSESVESDTTEEGELKSPKRSRKRSPVTIIDETTTSWDTLPQSAISGLHGFVEKTECSPERDTQPMPDKNPLVSEDATERTELDTGEAFGCLARKGDVKVANGPTVSF